MTEQQAIRLPKKMWFGRSELQGTANTKQCFHQDFLDFQTENIVS